MQGFIVGGATGVVRAGTSFARAIQTGYLRAYALLLLLGVAGLALYFLIAELVTIHLSIVLFLPLADRPARRVPAARHGALGGAGRDRRGARLRDRRCWPTSTPGGGLQYVTDDEWIPELGIRYQLGVDGLNLFMVALTALAWVPCTLVAAFREHDRPRLFFFNLALGETAVLGAFLAQDLALFIVFFDLMLVPFYFLIGGWGTGDRVRATTKFVIYTLAGSLLMLAGGDRARRAVHARRRRDLVLARRARSSARSREGTQQWIVLLFALAFFVKAPLFPLHGWVPETYRSSPIVDARAARRPCSRRSASTASCGSCCRSCPRARSTGRSCSSSSRSSRSCTGRSWPSRRTTCGWWSPTPRSRSSASSCWASSPSTTRAPRARSSRCSTTGSWWCRCS